MENKENKTTEKKVESKQSAGQVLPENKKHLKEKMPEHLQSPLHELSDDVDAETES